MARARTKQAGAIAVLPSAYLNKTINDIFVDAGTVGMLLPSQVRFPLKYKVSDAGLTFGRTQALLFS